MFIVVSYDVVDDKRRMKVANTLKDYGRRVQFSVFECLINEKILKEMKERTSKLINDTEDSLRFYQLCEGCVKKIEVRGSSEVTEDRDVYII